MATQEQAMTMEEGDKQEHGAMIKCGNIIKSAVQRCIAVQVFTWGVTEIVIRLIIALLIFIAVGVGNNADTIPLNFLVQTFGDATFRCHILVSKLPVVDAGMDLSLQGGPEATVDTGISVQAQLHNPHSATPSGQLEVCDVFTTDMFATFMEFYIKKSRPELDQWPIFLCDSEGYSWDAELWYTRNAGEGIACAPAEEHEKFVYTLRMETSGADADKGVFFSPIEKQWAADCYPRCEFVVISSGGGFPAEQTESPSWHYPATPETYPTTPSLVSIIVMNGILYFIMLGYMSVRLVKQFLKIPKVSQDFVCGVRNEDAGRCCKCCFVWHSKILQTGFDFVYPFLTLATLASMKAFDVGADRIITLRFPYAFEDWTRAFGVPYIFLLCCEVFSWIFHVLKVEMGMKCLGVFGACTLDLSFFMPLLYMLYMGQIPPISFLGIFQFSFAWSIEFVLDLIMLLQFLTLLIQIVQETKKKWERMSKKVDKVEVGAAVKIVQESAGAMKLNKTSPEPVEEPNTLGRPDETAALQPK